MDMRVDQVADMFSDLHHKYKNGLIDKIEYINKIRRRNNKIPDECSEYQILFLAEQQLEIQGGSYWVGAYGNPTIVGEIVTYNGNRFVVESVGPWTCELTFLS